MSPRRFAPVAAWLGGILACILVVAHTAFTTDMSAFLPRSPEPGQQLLLDQLQNGVVSRLVLIGLEGAPPDRLAALSKALATDLRDDDGFVLVQNGDATAFDKDRELVWRNRYLLSPTVTPERFTASGLRRNLEGDLRLLGSTIGMLAKNALPSDPTGEMLGLLTQFSGGAQAAQRDGVWFSSDGSRAMLLAQTRAAGFDIDGQERAQDRIRAAFDRATAAGPDPAGALVAPMRLLISGPGVFAVRSRAAMKEDVSRLSTLATVLVFGILLAVYRSPRVLLLAFLPVVSGALAGVAAVSLGFGFVHGITLGFGITLIGEAVDYAIYLFTQTEPGSTPEKTLPRLWPTLRLGLLTSICGFSAMLLSSFTGFAQLGLYTITGLVTAAGVTRWVLPLLVPRRFVGIRQAGFEGPLVGAVRRAGALRRPLLLLVLVACLLPIVAHRGSFWQDELSSMSPVPSADLKLDQQLRRDMGSPDVRYIVVAAAPDEQQALAASEALATRLTALVERGALAGFDAPDRYLPSRAAQQARQAALPDPDQLTENLRAALAGLPFRPDLFQPFIAAVAAARSAPLLTRASLQGTTLALRLDSLLAERDGRFLAMLPLRGVTDAAQVAAALRAQGTETAALLDLKGEADRLLEDYRREALLLALIGGLAITALLAVSLRAARRVGAVLAPLAGAVLLTTVAFSLGDQRLSVFNLFGLLLVVAVGSNYCLFFERQDLADPHAGRTVTSLLLANLCTVVGFGVLSFSRIPVLHDIGGTVALGTLLSLVLSAIWTPLREPPAREPSRQYPAA